jgi:hypothetical protein
MSSQAIAIPIPIRYRYFGSILLRDRAYLLENYRFHREATLLKSSKYLGGRKRWRFGPTWCWPGPAVGKQETGGAYVQLKALLARDGYIQWDQRIRLGEAGPALQFVVWLDFSAPSYHDLSWNEDTVPTPLFLRNLLFKRSRQRSRTH